jgi:hypothetical protein
MEEMRRGDSYTFCKRLTWSKKAISSLDLVWNVVLSHFALFSTILGQWTLDVQSSRDSSSSSVSYKGSVDVKIVIFFIGFSGGDLTCFFIVIMVERSGGKQ